MKRQRYCDIKAKSLEDILATCERHVRNINMTQMDMIEEGDGTDSDYEYCSWIREMWLDMRDDVQAMLDKQAKKKK